MVVKRKISGIIIIGDEILSGKTLDTNSNFISKELGLRGIDVKEISIIKDDKKIIINKTLEFSEKFDYVFTTGGIGPTHDDLTTEAISAAFDKVLELNEEAHSYLKKHYTQDELTKARLKMAYLPKGSNLILNPVSLAPGFYIKNVYVFPGVPEILKAMFFEFIDKFSEKEIMPQINISTLLSEGVIADYIKSIQQENPKVSIGSYPYFKSNLFGVSLILKSQDKDLLQNVGEQIFYFLDKKKGKPKYF